MKTDEASTTIFRYDTSVASVRNRVTLQQNLFSFLLEGEKTVFYAGSTISINPGQFLLLSAGNCLMSEMTAVKGGAYRSLLIKFDNKVLADFSPHTRTCSVPEPVNWRRNHYCYLKRMLFWIAFSARWSSCWITLISRYAAA